MPFGSFRMMLRRLFCVLAVAPLALATGPAWAKCELSSVAALPVTMLGMRALLPAKINGQDVQFVVDSGAFFSFITAANADKFKLPRQQMPTGVFITGITGDFDANVGIVKVLTLANAPLHNVQFVVGGGEFGEGSVGLLGQNILGLFDVEYDLAKGSIHLWSSKGCSSKSDMGYWSTTAPEAIIDLDTDAGRYVSSTKGPVYVNGVRLKAIFDTGAPGSIMTREAAAKAGIKTTDPDVIAAGYEGGAGKRLVRSWIATVKSFKIGDEEIRNTKMRFGDIELTDADMLVGADFFLAHHIFVSNHQQKLYLTYNGGPVFDMSQTPTLLTVSAPGAPPIATPPTTASDPYGADPTDAAGLARRGAGFAARNDLAPAIADLSKAITMAPTVPDYTYQRGLIYLRNKQPFLAMADFDQTLKLKPDDVPALIARAALRLGDRETAQAVQDLEAADKASAKQDDVHLEIAVLYERADLAPAAIDQFSLWIDAHSEDARLPEALNSRCWLRALTGVDLDKALNDCNRAIRNAPKNAAMLDSRGLVRLRLGDLDKAIADYDAALAINPKLGWSLYGRGLAKQRKGLNAEGAADIAAAVAINPKLTEEVKKRGLTS
jgi:tetratricopeptide (TPR) repeat protein/predicted aspartyl protease